MRYFKKLFWVIILNMQFLAASGYATNGILDLRYESFEIPVALSGQWEFYWSRLIMPHELFVEKQLIQLPALWNEQTIGKKELTGIGFATYRLKVLLPEKATDYELYIHDMYTSYKMYINGKEVAANGVVGIDAESSEPKWLPKVIPLPGLKGACEIIIHVSNWEHSKGGISNDIYLGIDDDLSSDFTNAKWYHITLFIIFIGAGIFFMIRFAFYSYDLSSFYFGLFALCYSYRLIGADMYVLHQLLPDYPWDIGIHLEYISLFASTIFFALYIRKLHLGLINELAINILIVVCSIMIAVTLIFPPSIFTLLVVPFFIIVLLYMNYGFYIYTASAVNGTIGSAFGVISVAVVFAIFIYQMFYYFSWLTYLYEVAFLGHLVFVVLQSIQLYLYSEYQRKQVERLDERL